MKLLYVSTLALVSAVISSPVPAEQKASKVISVSNIKWGYLNPQRGDKSPGAADLWGNRITDTATGMLVRFKKGFESPPHIHNISYRGIVIKGAMHNDDPTAEKMWMPVGSFWTQPAGENHVTAADSETNLIYLEIDSGPYLVKPTKAQFDNGERPLNLHSDNMVWLNSSDLNDINAKNVKTTYLWGNTTALNGSLIKLPAGFKGDIQTNASEFRAVIITGILEYNSNEQLTTQTLGPGSYIESTGNFTHRLENKSDKAITLYIRSNSNYQVN